MSAETETKPGVTTYNDDDVIGGPATGGKSGGFPSAKAGQYLVEIDPNITSKLAPKYNKPEEMETRLTFRLKSVGKPVLDPVTKEPVTHFVLFTGTTKGVGPGGNESKFRQLVKVTLGAEAAESDASHTKGEFVGKKLYIVVGREPDKRNDGFFTNPIMAMLPYEEDEADF